MSQEICVISVALLLILQGTPSREAVSVSIESPLAGTLSGIVDFSVAFDNSAGANLTISLMYSPEAQAVFEILAQETTAERHGSVTLMVDTRSLDNGNYHVKAVGDNADETVESEVVSYKVFNPKEPILRWASPKGSSVLKGPVQFTVNVTGDHGGLDGDPMFHFRTDGAAQWSMLGHPVQKAGTTLWSLVHDTISLPDSEYYFLANVTSVHGIYSEAVIGPVKVDNEHAPAVSLLEPAEGSSLQGKVALRASASDPDDNLNSDGVVFYYSVKGSEAMTRIGNDPSPEAAGYGILMDTARLANGRYMVWAYVRDTGTPSTSLWSGVNVTIKNPLVVEGIRSLGEEGATWTLEVLVAEGPKAYPLSMTIEVDQGSGWIAGGRFEQRSEPIEAGPIKVRAAVPLAVLREGDVSVRAVVQDAIGVQGALVVDDLFSYRPFIVPVVAVIGGGPPLVGNATLFAEVTDDDVPLKGPVEFWYSTDNKTWHFIGIGSFHTGRTYKVVWDTSLVENFTDYHVKVNHTDSDGLIGEGYRGGFEVRNEHPLPPPPPPEEKPWYETKDNQMRAVGIIALVAALFGAMVALTVGMARRSARRREKRRKAEEERERMKGIGYRARQREKELNYILTVGSKFVEPKRTPTPRGAVPLKPSEKGLKKEDDIEPPREKVRVQEFEHPPTM